MNILEVKNLSKKYSRDLRKSLKYAVIDSTKDLFGKYHATKVLRPSEFWALRDISFDLKKGESIGLIGRNGSGKTTLLKVLNSLIKPTYGNIHINGTIGALIALGTGFNPILTGRENVRISAAVLGFDTKSIDEMMDEIIDFSEIGEFIDAPVRTYSSGMLVRLGFSVAIQMKPDILFVDEVLAVGDLAFMVKCQKKITEYRNSGGSMVLVSHGLHNIRFHCDRAIWINNSELIMDGETHKVCNEYETNMQKGDGSTNDALLFDKNFNISSVSYEKEITSYEKAEFIFEIEAKRDMNNPIIEFCIFDGSGNPLIQRFSDVDKFKFGLKTGTNKLRILFDSLLFKSGTYYISFILNEDAVNNSIIYCHNSYKFDVKNDNTEFGVIANKPEWSVEIN